MIALIHIKKTAGKTIKHLKRCEYGAAHCDAKRWRLGDECLDAAGLARIRRIMPQCQSIAGHSVRPYSNLRAEDPDIAFYTFLREPVRRCISQYQYEVTQGRIDPNTFDQWIKRDDVRNTQVASLAGNMDLAAATDYVANELTFVGLTEAFEESLAMMPSLLRTRVIRPQKARVNAAVDNTIRDRLLADAGAMARVRAANAQDIELYDYVRRVIYPRVRQRASRTTLAVSPRRSPVNGRFVTNALVRYGFYKPAVGAWRLSDRLAG